MEKKCICFSRVSSTRQDLEGQRVAILNAALKEYKKEEIIEVSGKESAVKLSEMERQTLTEMKELVEQYPSIESIYFFAVDRLARRVSVVMSIKEWADDHQINLVFLNPYPFSTWFTSTDGKRKKNDISDVYLMFLGFGAKMEIEIKNERFAAAKKVMVKNNQVIGHLLFGYKKGKDKKIEIDPNQAQAVKWVFNSYLNKDMSCVQIYDEGVSLGYFKPLKSRSSRTSNIANMLSNYAYSGEQTDRLMTYPAIISREDIDAAIAKMKSRQYTPKSRTKHVYLAKGKIRDYETGYMLRADVSDVRYVALVDDVKQYSISMNVCDTIIWRSAQQSKWMMLQHKDINERKNIQNEIDQNSQKINTLKKIAEDYDRKMNKAYEAFILSDGRISPDQYQNTLRELEKSQNEALTTVNRLQKRNIDLSAMITGMSDDDPEATLDSILAITDEMEMKRIIDESVNCMTIHRAGNKTFQIHVDTVYPLHEDYVYEVRGRKSILCAGGVDITNSIMTRFVK